MAYSPGPARGNRTSKRILSESEDDHAADGTPRSAAGGSSKKKKTGKRPAPASDDEDELESEEDEDTPAGRQRLKAKAKGKGRANGHANGNGDDGSDEEMGEGDEDGLDNDVPLAPPKRPEYDRGEDGYVAGSVVRIKMINFMCYDHVELKPGPRLNMLLGPNGTGKSSVAAAIAIGLGFSHKTMSRNELLRTFIKQGCDFAEVEVELKGHTGKRNPVIVRRFTTGNEQSVYKLNGGFSVDWADRTGQSSTHKAVSAIAASFGVQARNLCCFLAQDNVANFAAQNSNEILTATMLSAGDSRLHNWYEKLKVLGARSKTIEGSLDTVKAERDNIQNQVNGLAADVRHFEEKESLEKQLKVLQCLLIAARRCELLRDLAVQKGKKSTLKKELAKRISRSGPIKELREHYKKKVDTARKRCTKAEDTIRENEKEIKDQWKQISRKEQSIEDISLALNRIKAEMKRDAKSRASIMERRQQAQDTLDQPVEDVQSQITEYNEARKQVLDRLAVMKREYAEVTSKYGDAQNRNAELTKILEVKARNIQGRKEDEAKNADATVRYVLGYLADHEADFEEKVYPPPLISVNLKDGKFANQVEAGTNWGQRCTFIVQTKNDYDRMLALNRHHFPPWQQRDRGGRMQNRQGGSVRINLALVQVDEQSLNPNKPCSPEVLWNLGFAGWASDYVEAEAPVIAFLNEKCGLARLAVTDQRGDHINADAVQRAGISKWATANEVVSVGRSKYGRQDTFMNVGSIKQAQSFNIVVDVDGVAKLQEEITTLKRQKRDLEEPTEELRLAQVEVRERGDALNAELSEIQDKLKELREKNAKREVAARTLRRADEDLAKLGSTESFETRKAALHAKMASNLKDRVGMITNALQEQEHYLTLASSLTKRRIQLIQLAADVKAIDAQIEATASDVSDLEQAIGGCTGQITAGNTQKKELDSAFMSFLRKLGDDTELVTSRLEEVEPPADDPHGAPALTSDQLTDDLQVIRVKLDLSVGIDKATVDKYYRLVEKLEGLKKSTDSQSKEFNGIRKDINGILRVFDPALQDLVAVVNEAFSKSFHQVGCTGAVELDRSAESFDQWGIKILVKYRDSEELAMLSDKKQSGGERSLATVTYFMALSGMSRTPFSLVDEINQGMDQRAERNVHNQMVKVTCDANAGQYFLITPKLLTDLTYHPKMKILNVNNGPWLPEPEGDKLQQRWADFRGCIQNYRRAKGM